MALSVEALPDLGQLRGLSAATLSLCSVRAVGAEHSYGAGWIWDTYTLEGVKAQRWKSVSSTRPNASQNWAKYRWLPEKPLGNASYYDPDGKLRAAIKAAAGQLYLVGGEVAAMSMFDASNRNTTCFFGDEAIPRETFYQDMKRLGVSGLVMIPDRDLPGQLCAVKVRDLVKDDLDFDFAVLALPYEIVEKHGKDVNEWWIDLQAAGEHKISLSSLRPWRLPEPEQKIIDFPSFTTKDTELPSRFVEAILRDVTDRADPNKAFRWASDGWSTNFRCPFHDDQQASAGFNRESMSFKCFACGAKSAKQYGEGVGIYLKDYFDDPIPLAINSPPQNVAYTNGASEKSSITVDPPQVPVKKLAPPLSAFAQLSAEQAREALSGRAWVDDYLTWVRRSCPLAPEIFHEAMALWLLATVSTRRMKLVIGGQEIYPNLYVLIVARTSLYRKSTAMNEAKKVLRQAGLECLLLPTDVTPEALFDELAGVAPVNYEKLSTADKDEWLQGRAVSAQRAFIKDECSSIFANLKKDYNAGLSELLLEGYQGDGGKLKKLLKSKGLITVKDMCLSFLGATTPVMYGKYIGNEEQENGFVARFAMITPEGIPVYETVDEPIPVPGALVVRLRRLFMDVLPWHNNERPSASKQMGEVITPPVTTVTIEAVAMKQLLAYRKALNYDMIISDSFPENKRAAYTRLGTMVVKVAMLLAAIEAEPGRVRIEPRHAYAAQLITERWRESLYRLELDVARSADNGNDKIMEYLRSAGEAGVSLREIMRDCGVKQRFIVEDALKTLYEDGNIEKYERKPDGAGRPSIRYRIVQTQRN